MGGHSAWRKRLANGELAKKSGGAIARHRPHLGRKGKDREVERKGNINGGPRKKKRNRDRRNNGSADGTKRGDGTRVVSGVTSRSFWPYLILMVRFFLAVIVQTIVAAGILFIRGFDSNPLQTAAPYWVVYGTFIDIGCLLLLRCLLEKEDIPLSDLLGGQKRSSSDQTATTTIRSTGIADGLLLSLGTFIVVVILTATTSSIAGKLIYGSQQDTPNPMAPLPPWASIYALVIWPIPWSIAEEMVYLGYALPRLQTQTKNSSLSILLVSIGWGLQHTVLPIVDANWAVYRFIPAFCLGIVLSLLYLRLPPPPPAAAAAAAAGHRQRPLWPFVLAHWAADALSVLMLVVLPDTTNGP